MNKKNNGLSDIRNEYLPLAQWLQQILATTPQHPKAELATITDIGGKFEDTYHLEFYRQVPDFVQALLNNATQKDVIRFGPLVFHLIECPTCHAAYLEIYGAMRATIGIDEARTSTSTSVSGSSRAFTTTLIPWACWCRRSPRCPRPIPKRRTFRTPSSARSRSSGCSRKCRRSRRLRTGT